MCNVTFNDAAGTGVLATAGSTNGVFTLLGYSTTIGGTYGAGGNWPGGGTQAYGSTVDTSAIDEGFYKFEYASTLPPADPCYGTPLEVIVPVVQGTGNVGADVNISVCSGDPVQNIFNDSGLYGLAAVNPVIATIGGTGTSSPGYSAGTAVVTDDTYDPSQEPSFPVTRVFEITYTPQPPTGYTLSSCVECQPDTVVVTYTVTEQFQPGTPSNVAACTDD